MSRHRLDAVELQVFRHLLAAIPEEMGAMLMRAAFSPNIKERRDYSCALTATDGSMAAQASHIPVHLGSTHVTARHVLDELELEPGDVVLLNDPYRGGTHLPDVTLFAPVFFPGRDRPEMGAMVRAHHADVGGAWPGSMGRTLDLHGEGLVIPPVKLFRRGVLSNDVLEMVLANTRTPEERRGDLKAQVSSAILGRERLLALAASHGRTRLLDATKALRQHAARATRSMLRTLADGTYAAEQRLDGAGSPRIAVKIDKTGDRLRVDFAGTDPQVTGPFNANRAITLSAVFYVVRMLVDEDLPTNSGCLDPVEVVLPEGSLLAAQRPAGVAGGNVETSQRIVDVLLAALESAAPDRIPAASQGTMNNLSVGGRDLAGQPFTFYETLAGGAGAGPSGPGASGIQSHMTNTLNTPVEAIETAFPVRVTKLCLREGSGGAGRQEGGRGIVRELLFHQPVRVTLLATRRQEGAPGAAGGGDGEPGRDRVHHQGRWRTLPADGSLSLDAGDRLRMETPGGGGFGRPPRRSKPTSSRDTIRGSRKKKPRGGRS